MEFIGYDAVIIRPNPNAQRDRKRLVAYFIFSNGKILTTKFGLHEPKRGTFADGASEQVRLNWIARHKPLDGGSPAQNNYLITKPKILAFKVLWETFSKSNKAIENHLKKILKADYVSVRFPRVKVKN